MFFLRNYFLNLNLFERDPNSTEIEDEQKLYLNKIATRLYLIVLIVILIILALYSWLSIQTTMVTFEHPTKDQFEILPVDAHCICSQTALSYGEFTFTEVNFHQICSSDFVSDRWIKAINYGSNSTYFAYLDFRLYGSAQFQALAAFCRLSKSTIKQIIASFDTSTLLSPEVLSESILRSKSEAAINQFQEAAPTDFKSQLQLVREITKGNKLMSGLLTSRTMKYHVDNGRISMSATAIRYGNSLNNRSCYCDNDIDCLIDSGMFSYFGTSNNYNNVQQLMKIPQISSGCLPVNSILQSTLECFYKQACVDQLIGFFPTNERFNAMSATEKSRFSVDSTVKSMVDLLMVENWMTNVFYEKYYTQCAPSACTYLKTDRHNLLFVLTKLISLLGGLTLVLGFVTPIFVQFIQRLWRRQQGPRIPRK